jgi:putative transposase
MAGYERHSVSLIFWLTAGSRNFPSEQPFRSSCDTSPLLLAIRPFQRCPRLSTANLPRGYDAGKKIKGRKRHALVDTDGRGLVLEPHPASIQDRDGGGALLKASRRIFPFIDRVFADGDMPASVLPPQPASSEIVNKHLDQVGFTVLPRRWVVERFFAWIGRNRRLAKDFEATIASARAFLYAASIMLLSRRMARAV